MAHEISFNATGKAEAAFAVTPAWHQLGEVAKQVMSREEAMRLSGLDQWEPTKVPQTWVHPVTGETITAETSTVIRSDDGRKLGEVSNDFAFYFNAQMADWMDALAVEGGMGFESAFALNEGRRVCLLARYPENLVIGTSDVTYKYVMMLNAHDGSRACEVWPTNVRAVCANTVRLALQQRERAAVRTIHLGDISGRMDAARQVLGIMDAAHQRFAAVGNALALAKFSDADVVKMLDAVFPLPNLDLATGAGAKASATRVQSARDRVSLLYAMPETDEAAGTAWGAFNAVTHYADHDRKVTGTAQEQDEKRVVSSMIEGAGVDLKMAALSVVCELAGVAL